MSAHVSVNLLSEFVTAIKCDACRAFKDICGYFQCAPFPRLQTGKVVWVLSFDP